MDNPHLHLIRFDARPPVDYAKLSAYRPDPIEMLRERLNEKRPSWFAYLAADCREVIGEIREHPVSHLLVGIGTFVGVTALIVLPTLIGAGK